MKPSDEPSIQPSASVYRSVAERTREHEFVQVSAVLARVNGDGAMSAELLTRVRSSQKRFGITLTTIDRDPTVALRPPLPLRSSELLLADREQVGPDSWDYSVALPDTSNELFIRLSMSGAFEDVAVLAADATVVLTNGWVDPTRHPAPALVSSRDLNEAISRLVARSEAVGS